MQIDLNDQERDELVKLLTVELSESNSELHHAMDHETRETYRQRRMLLKSLINKLGATIHAVR